MVDAKEQLRRDYFSWLYNMVGGGSFSVRQSKRRLCWELFNIWFTYDSKAHPLDGNRLNDGLELRHYFANELVYVRDKDDFLDYMENYQCSVLEFMIALSRRIVDNYVSNLDEDHFVPRWFWDMINNLGLGTMTDMAFNKAKIDVIIFKMLDRQYDYYGEGNIFYINDADTDLRDMDIWAQMTYYVQEVLAKES